jgi:3-oxosteroid 1-dehydrogenase
VRDRPLRGHIAHKECGDGAAVRRGSAYDRAIGDPAAPHPSLGTIEQPPFFAVRVHRGTVGTKGGPRTDTRARVLGWDGAPIDGLYAAGNAMAGVLGPGTVAPGLTLGLALTWGWIAGTAAGHVGGRGRDRAGSMR